MIVKINSWPLGKKKLNTNKIKTNIFANMHSSRNTWKLFKDKKFFNNEIIAVDNMFIRDD